MLMGSPCTFHFSLTSEKIREKIWKRPEEANFEELLQALLFCGLGKERSNRLSRSLAKLARTPKGLFYLDPETMATIPGIGEARVSAIIAAIEIARRQNSGDWSIGKEIKLDYLARHLQIKLEGLGKENFYLFSFNRSLGLIQEHLMAKGNAEAVQIYYRDIAKTLLNDRAFQTLIAHNHPDESGMASNADLISMHKIENLLGDLGIFLIDQYIVGIDGVYSCKQKEFLLTQ